MAKRPDYRRRPASARPQADGPPVKVMFFTVALALALVWIGWRIFNAPSIDANTQCPDKISRATVFLADSSSAFSDAQKQGLENALLRTVDGLKTRELLLIYKIDQEQSSLAKPVFEKCMVPRTEAETDTDIGSAILKKRYSAWLGDVNTLIEKLKAAPASAKSPIMEYIADIASSDRFSADKIRDGRHLVVFSDLAQNMPPDMDQAHPVPAFRDWKETAYARDLHPSLDGATITFYYVRRRSGQIGRLQAGSGHRQFWRDYAGWAGAKMEPDRFQTIEE